MQNNRNKKIRDKNFTEFSEKNVIHSEWRKSVHWIRWQTRKFTKFSDEFFTGGYSAHICIEYMKSLIKISQKILSSTLIAKLKNIQMVGSLVQPTCLFYCSYTAAGLVCPICDRNSAGAPQRGVKVRTNVIGTPNMCVAQRHISRLRQCLTNLPIVTLCSSTERRQMLLSVHDYVHVVAFNQT